jgi:hypothetical protein
VRQFVCKIARVDGPLGAVYMGDFHMNPRFFWLKCLNKPLQWATEKEWDPYYVCVQIVHGTFDDSYADSDTCRRPLSKQDWCHNLNMIMMKETIVFP